MPLPEEFNNKVKLQNLIDTFNYVLDNAVPPPQDLPVASTTQLGAVVLASDLEIGNDRVATSNLVRAALDEEVMYKVEPLTYGEYTFSEGTRECVITAVEEQYAAWLNWFEDSILYPLTTTDLVFKIKTSMFLEQGFIMTWVEIFYYNQPLNKTFKIAQGTITYDGFSILGNDIEICDSIDNGSPGTNHYAIPGATHTIQVTGTKFKAIGTPPSGTCVVNTWQRLDEFVGKGVILTKNGTAWTETYSYGTTPFSSITFSGDQITINYATPFTLQPVINLSMSLETYNGSTLCPRVHTSTTSQLVVRIYDSVGQHIIFDDINDGVKVYITATLFR